MFTYRTRDIITCSLLLLNTNSAEFYEKWPFKKCFLSSKSGIEIYKQCLIRAPNSIWYSQYIHKSNEQFWFIWQNNVSLLFIITCNANNKERKGTIEMVLQARFYFLLSFIWLGYTHKRRLIFTTGKWVLFFVPTQFCPVTYIFQSFFLPLNYHAWVVELFTPLLFEDHCT